jgi:4-hydroxy-2-oxoheptanedioate aldolase
MSVRVNVDATLRDALRGAGRPLVGMWVCTGSPLVAEICAGSGLDWLLIDAEHAPNGLESVLAQLQAVYGYPITPVVRPPIGDPVLIKQYLDLGVQNLLIPMVDTAERAEELVRAVRYPPEGIRGVGGALARSSRWNRIPDYAHAASETISLYVQIESGQAVRNIAEILAVEGVDGIFLGPADLAASMGHLGQQDHPEVIETVEQCIKAARDAGKPVGANAFAHELARRYLTAGADFILVGADVQLLMRGGEQLCSDFIDN